MSDQIGGGTGNIAVAAAGSGGAGGRGRVLAFSPDQPKPVGVQVSSTVPGVVPVAFVAYVELVDEHGDLRVVRVDSDGLTADRAARILGGET